jgi:hypothetical protein
MLHGSVEDVVEASKKAIDDAAEGGGFILAISAGVTRLMKTS